MKSNEPYELWQIDKARERAENDRRFAEWMACESKRLDEGKSWTNPPPSEFWAGPVPREHLSAWRFIRRWTWRLLSPVLTIAIIVAALALWGAVAGPARPGTGTCPYAASVGC